MADRVGQQLGNYRLLSLLGKGGFSDVYLGEHIYLKVPAAIKVLQTRVGSQEELKAFLNEAQTIARLLHPNIIRVLDFGVDSETPFLVMDYAPNGSIRQRYPRGSRLPMPILVSYIKQIASATQYAHDQKLIHRDIKPENILLGRQNEVLLSDFGIALVAQSSLSQNTNTQDVTGTVAYMAPEQIQGKPRPASDQYSLGIVAYEWLSGEPPFHGSFTELCAQQMFAPPPPLHEKVPSILPDIENVVSIALSKDPKQRFGSILAFANALEQATQSRPSAAITSSQSPLHVSTDTPQLPLVEIPPTLQVQQPESNPQTFPPTMIAQQQIEQKQLPVTENDAAIRQNVAAKDNERKGDRNRQSPILKGLGTLLGNPNQDKHWWHFSRNQILVIVCGALLFGMINPLLIFLGVPGDNLKYIFLLPAIIVTLYFGAVFGSRAGILIGASGYLLSFLAAKLPNFPYWFLSNDWTKLYYNRTLYYSTPSDVCANYPCDPNYIQDFDHPAGFDNNTNSNFYYPYYYGHIHYHGDFNWQSLLAHALIGLLIGIVFILARRKFHPALTIMLAALIGALGTFVSLTIADLFYDGSTVSLSMLYVTLPTSLAALILLPLLLTITTLVSRLRSRA